MYVCMYVHMCMYIYIYIYIIYTQTCQMHTYVAYVCTYTYACTSKQKDIQVDRQVYMQTGRYADK